MCEEWTMAEAVLKSVEARIDDKIDYLIHRKGIHERAAKVRYQLCAEDGDVDRRKSADRHFEKAYECHKAIKVLESLKEQIDKEIKEIM